MRTLEHIAGEYVKDGRVEHLAIRVGMGEKILFDLFHGADENTLFDMASITKVIATTSLALIAIDNGLLKLNDAVDRYYATDKPITINNLLTHTIGIGHKALNQEGNTYENIAEKILEIPLDVPIGEVKYSCPAFILLGKILEKTFGKRLDSCFNELVAGPLGMGETSFLPKDKTRIVNANLNEETRGIVNDYNCRFLGGVAGNAGIFSSLADMTKYARFLANRGAPIVSEKTFLTAAQTKTVGKSETRAIGFAYVDDSYEQTGGLFKDGAIGHCGHTGQSVFVDYRTGLYVIILSDATLMTRKKFGAERYGDVMKMREEIHAAIKKDLEERERD